LEQSFSKADAMDHKLSDNVMNMLGMSGRKYRTLINRLIENTPDARYLEVGSWKGSTSCAAMYNNTVVVKCIDNWYEGVATRDAFLRNVELAKTPNVDFSFIHDNFENVDYTSIGKFNVYMFDGPHEKLDQYNGVKLALPALDNIYTLIVDDYNDKQVQDGTVEALADLNQTVIASITILSHDNPYLSGSDWHNGYFIAVIKQG
jgi:hypothetical protein